ncbi:T9SS type A sorting domain-containing protein [Epilithonimonas hungarica]|uniref:Por secretion system C-terminal sorting domain-containing protein n=1 Tax=Epilithonimonas hungarica TaxID=454006 RepID=A0A1G7V3L8_9FLAO|nr:T9SS type A sorting domain-containing protein [Epilithonimonas hungarica]SDG54356.1 Por secretion system C-terminal sorting domain-containing protein [Epilithonimonas hungarica]
MKKIYLLLVLILSITTSAQNILNTKLVAHNYSGSGSPSYIAEYEGKIIFSGNRPYEFGGNELWSYDEASGKAKVLKNFAQSFNNYYSRIKSPIINFKGKLYFVGTNLNDNNNQLWVTDGTEEGTKVVKQLYNSSAAYVYIDIFTNGEKLFVVTDYQLWSSDGTFAGTIALTGKNYKSQYYFLNNKLYYSENNYNQHVIMESDGTVGGTKPFKVFEATDSSLTSLNFGMIKFQNQLFFLARNNGIKALWSTDGTEAGTKSIIPINDVSSLNGDVVNDKIVFYDSKNNLWSSDGTQANTKIVKSFTETISKIFKFKDEIYLDTNLNIWKTDGSTENTVQANLTTKDSDLDFATLSSKKNYLIFKSSEQYNSGIWISDENASNAKKINFGNGYWDGNYIELDGNIFFYGLDGQAGTGISEHGGELYKYNVLTKEDKLAIDTNFSYNSYLSSYLKIGNSLFYIASTSSIGQKQLFKKSINSGELTQVSNFTANIGTVDKTLKVGDFYYAYSNYNSNGFIKSDGIKDNTKFIPVTEEIISFNNFKDQAVVYVTKSDKLKVYLLENNSSIPVLLKEMPFYSNDYYSKLNNGYMLDDFLYFSFMDENSRWSIWKTDGTVTNTKKAIDFSNESVQMLKIVGVINSKIVFYKSTNVQSGYVDLYSSDGTQAGTSLLKNINTSFTNHSLVNDGILYFLTFKSGTISLYKTDGTINGTALVKALGSTNLSESSSYSDSNVLTKCGNDMFILHNNRLYRSNGTTIGTTYLSANLTENEMACSKNYLYTLNTSDPRIVRFGGINTSFNVNIVDSNTNIEEDYSVLAVPFKNIASDGNTLYFSAYTNKAEYIQLHTIDQLPDLQVENLEGKDKIAMSVYPNPTSSYVKIQSPSRINKVEVYNFSGVKIFESKSDNLDFIRLNSGIYLVKVYTDDFIETKKVIKK